MQSQCIGTRKDGQPCGAPATADGYCVVHSDTHRERQRENQRRGGAARSNANRAAKKLPGDLKDVGAMLLQAMRDVRDDNLDPRKAQALAALANSYRGVFETGTLDQKLAEIDERLKQAESIEKGGR